MSKDNKEVWYHCGNCGALFEYEFGYDESRKCTHCEKSPRVTMAAGMERTKTPNDLGNLAGFNHTSEPVRPANKVKPKQRHLKFVTRVVIVWVLLLAGIVGLRYSIKKSDSSGRENQDTGQNLAKGTLADENVALLNMALPECNIVLGGFLSAGTPEAKNQYVADSASTAGQMARYYKNNGFSPVDLSLLRRVDQKLIELGGEKMIFTRWEEKGDSGYEFDAIFRLESSEWKLDWRHFVKYSDYPWSHFLVGGGPDEGVFRLLAELEPMQESMGSESSRLNLLMYAPVWGRPRVQGRNSYLFSIERSSPEGGLLEAAFQARLDGKPLIENGFPMLEPKEFVHVTVKLKREEVGDLRIIKITELLACHWIDSEDPGITLEDSESSSLD